MNVFGEEKRVHVKNSVLPLLLECNDSYLSLVSTPVNSRCSWFCVVEVVPTIFVVRNA